MRYYRNHVTYGECCSADMWFWAMLLTYHSMSMSVREGGTQLPTLRFAEWFLRWTSAYTIFFITITFFYYDNRVFFKYSSLIPKDIALVASHQRKLPTKGHACRVQMFMSTLCIKMYVIFHTQPLNYLINLNVELAQWPAYIIFSQHVLHRQDW